MTTFQATCPDCGTEFNWEAEQHPVACPSCENTVTGKNTRTGEIYSWTSAKRLGEINAEFAYHQFTADNNALYGRGNW